MVRTPRPGTVLQRASAIHVELTAGETVHLHRHGERVSVNGHALAILDVFARPRRFADGMAELQRRVHGAHDWMEMMSAACRLFDAGFLEDVNDRAAPVGRDRGYGSAAVHIRMLEDETRTRRFQAAIRAVVGPGDVVLDIGTGTGILAVTAAQAGARHVYAMESSAIGDAARQVFAANGVADRVTLLTGRSTRLELPQRADVLVSELLGDPLDEDVLEVFADAHRRLLKPNARIIPQALGLMLLPFSVPADYYDRFLFTADRCDGWRQRYGVDFSPLPDAEASGARRTTLRPQSAREWPRLGDPATLARYDLRRFSGRAAVRDATLTLSAAGRFNGVMQYFAADLTDGIRLSLDPAIATDTNHWEVPLWLLHPGFDGMPGHRYRVTLADPSELRVTSQR